MKTIMTPHGTVEILNEVNGHQVHIRFKETGGEVITSLQKLKKGTVKDPLSSVDKEPRWVTHLADGTFLHTYSLTEVADKTGVHEATVRKIAQKERHHPDIVSINKI